MTEQSFSNERRAGSRPGKLESGAAQGIQFLLGKQGNHAAERQTAVVTGASGIGKATAEVLAEAGAHVLIGDLDEANGNAVAAAIREKGQGAVYIRLDVADPASVAAFKDAACALRPQVDIVANVAGWGKIQPFMENTPEFWRKVMDVNLLGPVAVTHAFLPGRIERNSGKVVTVSSDAGRVGSLGETMYSAAKGGAIAFTKSLAG